MVSADRRLLVVGGTGFIGRHVVARAVTLGWQVTTLSARPAESTRPASVSHVIADITDLDAVRRGLADAAFEYVVNCGGHIDHTPYARGGRGLIDAHFGGVMNLTASVRREALLGMVNLGSSDEYGSSPAPQEETQREAPIAPYSLGKVAATHFLQMLHRTEGFPATTLRLFLVYGPGQAETRFLPQVIRGCLEGRSFPTSEGRQLRDFCFVTDTVDAVFAALTSSAGHGEVINIGSGQPVAVRDVIEAVQRLVGQGAPVFGQVPYRTGESMALYADIAKASALLGWRPRVSLDTGLRATIRALQAHT